MRRYSWLPARPKHSPTNKPLKHKASFGRLYAAQEDRWLKTTQVSDSVLSRAAGVAFFALNKETPGHHYAVS